MTLPWFARVTVAILTYPVIDDHGAKVVDYGSTPSRLEITGCSWQPSDGQEETDRRESTMRTGRLFLPAFSPINGTSLVEVASLTYQVIGDPADWSSAPFHPHIVAVLQRWEG